MPDRSVKRGASRALTGITDSRLPAGKLVRGGFALIPKLIVHATDAGTSSLQHDATFPATDSMRRRGYAGGMLHHFAGVAPRGWLDSHVDSYVVTVKLRLKRPEWPRHADGSVDLETFPERIFGPEQVVRHPDGSAEIVGVPEWRLREPPGTRVLHRATCETLQALDDDAYQMICGTRDELDERFAAEDVSTCQVCLG